MPSRRTCVPQGLLVLLLLAVAPFGHTALSTEVAAAIDAQVAQFESDAVVVYCGEERAYGSGALAEKYNVASVRKSLVSALYGIAAERGLVDLDASLAQLAFDDALYPLSAAEREATLRQLLKSRSGIYLPAHGESPSMRRRKPERGSYPPGAHFYYNNWDFNALGLVFEQVTGTALGEAFQDWIAEPVGMEDFQPGDVVWQPADERAGLAMYRFFMSARDLARFGVLYATGGRWREQQLVPAAWIRETHSVYSAVPYGIWDGYGLLWWYKANSDSWWALGSGGQRIIVGRERRATIVTLNNTGQGPASRWWYRHFGRAAPEWEAFSVLELATGPGGCS